MEEWRIRKYTEKDKEIWDEFIKKESINGVFLQSRKFLNYHKPGRFQDCSIMVYLNEKLVAVCPACEIFEDGEKVFFSHKGSTYGGLVLCREVYKTQKLLELMENVEEYVKEQGYDRIVFKPTMNLLSAPSMDLMEYCFYYRDYTEYKEINTYINYRNYDTEVLNNLSKMKQRIIKKCIKNEMSFYELQEESEIEAFHEILSKNLMKFEKKPVHTVEELLELKTERFPEEIHFFGVRDEEKLVAGTMVFEFAEKKCAHTQYLAADLDYNKLSPMSFVYYKVAEYYMKKGYDTLSWGISTEDMGRYINMGLTNNKEEFGSEHGLIKIYEKSIKR